MSSNGNSIQVCIANNVISFLQPKLAVYKIKFVHSASVWNEPGARGGENLNTIASIVFEIPLVAYEQPCDSCDMVVVEEEDVSVEMEVDAIDDPAAAMKMEVEEITRMNIVGNPNLNLLCVQLLVK